MTNPYLWGMKLLKGTWVWFLFTVCGRNQFEKGVGNGLDHMENHQSVVVLHLQLNHACCESFFP